MRRPVMYLAGLLLATGASLALAGPASAAPSHHHHCHGAHSANWWHHNRCHFYDDDDSWGYYEESNAQNNGSSYRGIVLLSGDSINGGLLRGPLL